MYSKGWFQVGFERDLKTELTPVVLGYRRLIIVKRDGLTRVFDADCPHRGANLANARFEGNDLVCPFHGYKIRCGQNNTSTTPFFIQERPSLTIGGLVFANLRSTGGEDAFTSFINTLARTHVIVAGFAMAVGTPADLVTENAFDNRHFRSVHHVANHPTFAINKLTSQEFVAEGVFELPSSPWQRSPTSNGLIDVPFLAHAFSPGIVISSLGGAHPYTTITGATPNGDSRSTIHLSLAFPQTEGELSVDRNLCQYLLKQNKSGIEQDIPIWQSLNFGHNSQFTAEDRCVVKFREFCEQFLGD